MAYGQNAPICEPLTAAPTSTFGVLFEFLVDNGTAHISVIFLQSFQILSLWHSWCAAEFQDGLVNICIET